MKKKKSVKKILLAASLTGMFIIGGIMAYFTNSDSVTNTFAVGDVKILLNEEKFSLLSADDKILLPAGAAIDKDPKVKNIGKNSAYVFVAVTIPTADVRVKNTGLPAAGEAIDGQIKLDHEIFETLSEANENDKYNKADWILVEGADLGEHTYLYAYAKDGKMTVLDPEAETISAVFDKTKLISDLYAWKQEEIEMLKYSRMTDAEKEEWLIENPRYNSDTTDKTDPTLRWNESVEAFVENNDVREYKALCEKYSNWLANNTEKDEDGWNESADDAAEYAALTGDKSAWLEEHSELTETEWDKAAEFAELKKEIKEWLEAHNNYTKEQWDKKKTETTEFYGDFIENTTMNIDIQAFAIQSSALNTNVPLEVWKILNGSLNIS